MSTRVFCAGAGFFFPGLTLACGQTLSYKEAFTGTWSGALSEWTFCLEVWEEDGKTMSTIQMAECSVEKLTVLGWKREFQPDSILYLLRPVDMASITLFQEDGVMKMAYFEKDAVRKVTLKKVGPPSKELLKEYRGTAVLPPALLRTYADLVAAFGQGSAEAIRRFCTAETVTITERERPLPSWGDRGEINLKFLKEGFDKYIRVLQGKDPSEWMIQTRSSSLWFILQTGAGWKLKDYLDRPN